MGRIPENDGILSLECSDVGGCDGDDFRAFLRPNQLHGYRGHPCRGRPVLHDDGMDQCFVASMQPPVQFLREGPKAVLQGGDKVRFGAHFDHVRQYVLRAAAPSAGARVVRSRVSCSQGSSASPLQVR